MNDITAPTNPDARPKRETHLELGNTEEAVEVLNGAIKKDKLWRLAREGLFPPWVVARAGRGYLWNLEALQSWVLNGGASWDDVAGEDNAD